MHIYHSTDAQRIYLFISNHQRNISRISFYLYSLTITTIRAIDLMNCQQNSLTFVLNFRGKYYKILHRFLNQQNKQERIRLRIMPRQESPKILAISGKINMKHSDYMKNDLLGNTCSCPEISFDTEDKNNLGTENVINQETKINNEEKVRKLIENIKIKQGNMKSHLQSSMLVRSDRNMLKSGTLYKNRFQTQRNVIELQKIKLQEQEKIINELKVGIITEGVRDCQDKNKIEIRELFRDCKMKMIGKVPLDYIPPDERQKLWIKTQNAPKIIQELEQRASDRMKYREMIKERKRILDETKRKMKEDALEHKRCLEEAEKKKQLETIKDKRNEELAKMKTRQINKENFLKNWEKAVKHNEIKLLKNAFSRWILEYRRFPYKQLQSEYHYKKCIMRKSFKALIDIVKLKHAFKYNIALEFYRKAMLRTTLQKLKENHMDCIRSIQVAEDFYDFTLQYKILKIWYRFISKEKILTEIKMHQAINHNRKTVLFQSFFQWKSLPTILKLERAREERKQKWRQKVWEILPDFSPSEI